MYNLFVKISYKLRHFVRKGITYKFLHLLTPCEMNTEFSENQPQGGTITSKFMFY